MLKLFTRYVIGGRSGKREACWVPFFLWACVFVWTVNSETQAIDMAATQEILRATFFPVMAFIVTAYGMEWVNTQTKWGVGE